MSAQEFHGAKALADGVSSACQNCFGTGAGSTGLTRFNGRDPQSTRAFKEAAKSPDTVVHSHGAYSTSTCTNCKGSGKVTV